MCNYNCYPYSYMSEARNNKKLFGSYYFNPFTNKIHYFTNCSNFRNAHSDMLEKVELESWPVEFCKNYKDLEIVYIFIISIFFLIQHNFILSRLVVYKKAFDIRRA